MSEKWYLGVAHVSRIILKTWHHFLPWVAVAVFSLHLFCLWLALRAGCCLFGPWVSAVASLLSLSLSFWLFANFFLQRYTLLKYNLKQKEGINFFLLNVI